MSENPASIGKEQTSSALEIVKLAEARGLQPARNVLFVPAIMGSLPTQETLDLFAASNNNVYAAIINNGYNASTIDDYVRLLRSQIKEKLLSPDPEAKVVLVGFSASCNMVVRTGKEIGLPREQILLVAPIWSPIKHSMDRIKGVYSSIKQRTPITHAFGVNTDYAHRLSQIASGRAFFTGYGNLRKFAITPVADLSEGIVISGGRDALSPRASDTDIYVPEAAHKFAQFASAVIEFISRPDQPQSNPIK